tara:strand:- start:6176 stop:6454 length:279 start_codon:yes stop_codon:yes gene_type:complete
MIVNPSGRKFLDRMEATYAFGLMDASQPTIQPEAVAVNSRIAIKSHGDVYESNNPKERLHANLVCALFKEGVRVSPDFVSGWTIDDNQEPTS